jgi:Holliday junction DNA helicase RuvA
MIEYLTGTIHEKSPTRAVILCSGVGYGVLISLTTFERLPEVGHTGSLYTYLAVREDALTLYGFAEAAEREMFLQLITVSGIGPKIAIGMLSSVGAETLRLHIVEGNATALQALPGIGKKSAERITLELRDKVGAASIEMPAVDGDGDGRASVRNEALAALVALGYSRGVSEKAIRAALKKDGSVDQSVEQLLKAALKNAV